MKAAAYVRHVLSGGLITNPDYFRVVAEMEVAAPASLMLMQSLRARISLHHVTHKSTQSLAPSRGHIPCLINLHIKSISTRSALSSPSRIAITPNAHRLRPRLFSKTASALSSGRTDVFYHSTEPPTPLSREKPALALSFLETPPPHASSNTIIGWMPAASPNHTSEQRPAATSLNGFVENSQFRRLLHKAIQDGLQKGVDEIHINSALQLQEGWMHIHDDRNLPPSGRIGDPDDIIASVLVRDSKIISETYQAMPSYRLCTADGLTKLTPGLAEQLHSLLRKEAEAEKSR